MCITEYNEAEIMQMFKEKGRKEGEDKFGKLMEILLGGGRTYIGCGFIKNWE